MERNEEKPQTRSPRSKQRNDGVPDPTTRRAGQEIARLRTLRKLSRSRLVALIHKRLAEYEDDPLFDQINDGWLTRFEDGRLVKLSHRALEIICDALKCTPAERVHVLALADRNILADEDGVMTLEAEGLLRFVDYIYRKPRVREALREALSLEDITDISEDRLLEVVRSGIAQIPAFREKLRPDQPGLKIHAEDNEVFEVLQVLARVQRAREDELYEAVKSMMRPGRIAFVLTALSQRGWIVQTNTGADLSLIQQAFPFYEITNDGRSAFEIAHQRRKAQGTSDIGRPTADLSSILLRDSIAFAVLELLATGPCDEYDIHKRAGATNEIASTAKTLTQLLTLGWIETFVDAEVTSADPPQQYHITPIGVAAFTAAQREWDAQQHTSHPRLAT